MADAVVLPAVMDMRAAAALQGEMLTRRGSPVILDASAVERLGGLSLQVLLSVLKTWAADGCALTIASASDAFADQCRAFGAVSLTDAIGEPA